MRTKRSLPGLLALGVASVMALSGAFGAGSAMAAEEPGEQCAGNAIEGGGSSLQNTAQKIWDGATVIAGKGFNLSANGSACNGAQGSKGIPKVTYNPVGSGLAKLEWGAENPLNKPLGGKSESPSESKYDFIGTDEPLSATQLENVDLAAGGTEQTLVIPVEQAAVAVIVNPPEECLITKITNENLQLIWNGEITEWSGVTGGATEGAGVTADKTGACNSSITRVVRKDSSGTTFVFKLYLNEIVPGTCAGTGHEWATFYALPEHNQEWPEAPAGTCNGKVTLSANEGGKGEVEEVKKTVGSIGYANLADAREQFTDETGDHFHWLGVQNQRATKLYPFPGTTTGEPSLTAGESNCIGTQYTGVSSIKVGADDNWSAVKGAHPGTKSGEENTNYPICTLRWGWGA
jgi:ABC-type phosphate transport system substrate-binding protein